MFSFIRRAASVSAVAISVVASITVAQASTVIWDFEGVWTSATDIAEPGTFSGTLIYNDAVPGQDYFGEGFLYTAVQLTSLTSFGSSFVFTNPYETILGVSVGGNGYWQFGTSTQPGGDTLVNGQPLGAFGAFDINNRGDNNMDIHADISDLSAVEVGLLVQSYDGLPMNGFGPFIYAQGYLTSVSSQTGAPSVVPVPAGFPLLAAGIGALGVVQRRRKNH
jgi:hypothetical protein